LWSVVVTQSTQRFVVRGAATVVVVTWGTGRAAYSVMAIR
jgi:hypothetical protein